MAHICFMLEVFDLKQVYLRRVGWRRLAWRWAGWIPRLPAGRGLELEVTRRRKAASRAAVPWQSGCALCAGRPPWLLLLSSRGDYFGLFHVGSWWWGQRSQVYRHYLRQNSFSLFHKGRGKDRKRESQTHISSAAACFLSHILHPMPQHS